MDQMNNLLVIRPKTWLKPPRQARTREDEAELRLLADNILAIGMLNPIVALETGEIVAGHRRFKAAMLKEEITDVPVRIIDATTARDIRVRRISENLHRSDLSFYDKWLECRGFRDDEPGITAKDIAELIQVDNSTVTRLLCLDHCVEAVRVAARENRIGVKAAYEISKGRKEEQEALLAEALAGGAEQVAKARKKSAEPDGTVPAGKFLNLKIVLSDGKAVVIKGENTLIDVAKLLKKALAEVEAAREKNLAPKTFAATMRDRAKGKSQAASEPPKEGD